LDQRKEMMMLRSMILSVTAGLFLLHSAANGQPHTLRVGPLLKAPLGYGDARVQFSWQLPKTMRKQTAYQIVCREAERTLWDSNWVASDDNTFVHYAGPNLKSRQRIEWNVRVKDEKGNASDWSAPQVLEMGLLSPDDWQSDWIFIEQDFAELPLGKDGKPDEKKYVSPPCTYLRREFTLSKPVASARLYVTARGVVEVQLNGKKVGADYLRPGWTEYNKRLLSHTYDVTEQLRGGANCIGAILAEGWYAGRLAGWKSKSIHKYGDTPQLFLQLEITHADGNRTMIVSDKNWRAATGPIRNASIYDGITYDARKALAGWSTPGYEAGGWQPVMTAQHDPRIAINPASHQPVRAIEELRAVDVTEPESGHYVFDFGQNMVGLVRLKLPVKAGQELKIRFAEMLNPDGTIYTENYRSARSQIEYTAAADSVVDWTPRFTFFGFRYAELSRLEAKPARDALTGVVLHNDMPQTGHFSSSHAKLNRLQSNIQWGQKGNFLAVPTDCPQRDERLGWTGDAQVFAPTANFNYNTLAFFEKWCRDMRDAQLDSGGIPNVIPDVTNKGTSSGWGDAATIVPWAVYRSFGYERILEDNYEMMKGLCRYYSTHPETKDLIHAGSSFGDWLQPYSEKTRGQTPKDLIGTAYFARSAQLTAKAGAVLGHDEESKTYETLSHDVAAAFTEEFFDGNGKLVAEPATQTGYLLALGFDLLPAEQRQPAFENLQKLITEEAGGTLRTGFLGTPLINPVLTRFGDTKLAYSVLFNDRYPGWFFSIDQGATTLWERWNSYSHEEGFGKASMNSFNHYAYGAIGEWLYESVAGLQAAQPGYRRMRIAPRPMPQLTRAEARLETPYGLARSAWQIEGGKLNLSITIPPNTGAEVVWPDGRKQQLPPGEHRLAGSGKPAE
jgi:alpha-L-rhamnosidase